MSIFLQMLKLQQSKNSMTNILKTQYTNSLISVQW